MKHWIADCLRFGKAKGFLTYTDVNRFAVGNPELSAEEIDECLLVLEEENIEVTSEEPIQQLDMTKGSREIYHKFPIDLIEGWKGYPVRLLGPRMSECHGEPTLLVQSMPGGFVTANCSACGKKYTLKEHEFRRLQLWISCPRCKRQMSPDRLSRINSQASGNYGYVCSKCQIYVLLTDLLPRWE